MDCQNPFQATAALLSDLESRITRLENLAKSGAADDYQLPPVLGVGDIMQFLDCSEYAAREIMRSPNLKTFRVGSRYQVTRSNFLSWMEKGDASIGPRNG